MATGRSVHSEPSSTHPPSSSWTWIAPSFSTTDGGGNCRPASFVSTAMAHKPTGSWRRGSGPDSGQCLLMQEAVRGEDAAPGGGAHALQVGEAATGLLDDDLQRGQVPEADLWLHGDIDTALGHQHVLPEIAESPRAPHGCGQVEESCHLPFRRPILDAGM